MLETLKRPSAFIVKSATLIGGVYVQARGGEAEDGGGQESEREVRFPYPIMMSFL
jgi:hypothetical protein